MEFEKMISAHGRRHQAAAAPSSRHYLSSAHQRRCRTFAILSVVCLLLILVASPVIARPSDARISHPVGDGLEVDGSVQHHQPQKRAALVAAKQEDEEYYDEDYTNVKRCHADEDLNELCQRCSKVAKSGIVYPMCCSNTDKTEDWCRAYVYYGIQN
ncbi:uncharacterized protein LOC129754991 [Uranotaenia lowii]|uniref:uncharacterized protein LOC129754991 n=1 Tax=Uranotaenia lowii TaxID=190385 RepID=UPI00247B22A7|nr:uncharacterized protein LOC129754991 [Uranotaenia lowii]